MRFKVIIKSPGECCDVELKSFEELVTAGGEVVLEGLRQRVQRAEKLFFIHGEGCVAVGAIKIPYVEYKASVFEKAGAQDQSRYQYELGWLCVSEAARGKGYGRALMESITHSLSGRACFATTREDNSSMHHLFSRFGFSRLGQPYKSLRGDYTLALYAKP